MEKNNYFNDFKQQVIKPSISLIKWTFILFVLFISIISASDFVFGLTGYEYLTSNSIAYWNLSDGNMKSSVNDLYNLTDYGTVNGTGFLNTARIIDTVSDNLTVPLTLISLQPYMYCFWFNFSATGLIFERITSNDKAIISLYHDTNQYKQPRTRAGVASDCTTNFGNAYFNKTTFICTGFDGSRVYAYVNGTLLQNCSSSAAGTTAKRNSTAFGSSETGSTTFRGTIDEISLFNRTLTLAEVQFLYNGGVPLNDTAYPFTNNATQITFISQSPSNISILNAVYGVNITYNYSDTNLNITSPYLNWSIKNSTGSYVYSYINGTQQPATYRLNYSNSSNISYRFYIDDVMYPGTYLINHNTMSNGVKYNYSLSSATNIMKIQFFNVSAKNYDVIEIALTMSGSNVFSPVYYCNSSYVSGLPLASGNCALIGDFNFSNLCNHYHNTSCHNVIPLSIVNGLFSGVTVSPTSSILVRGSGLGTVYVEYINGTQYTNMSMLSTNGGLSYSNLAITPDAHIHYYNLNDSFNYFPVYSNSTGTLFSGTERTDYFDILSLQPSGVNVESDKNSYYYYENITFNRSNSSAFFNASISYYSFYLYNENLTINTLILNNTNVTTVSYNTTNLTNGYYYPVVIVYDTLNQSTISYGELVSVGSRFIEPCNTTTTINSTGVPVYFNFIKGTFSNNITIKGNQGLINITFANDTGNFTFNTSTVNGLYSLYLYENLISNTDCTLSFCRSSYVQVNERCIDNLRLVNYTDVNNCAVFGYDIPSDYLTQEDCVLTANTDKGLWLIILLFVFFIVLLIVGMRFPLVMIGTLMVSVFLSIQMVEYFTDYKVIVMLLFPVITIIFSGLSLLLNRN